MGVIIPFNHPQHKHSIRIETSDAAEHPILWCSLEDAELERHVMAERYSWNAHTGLWECMLAVSYPDTQETQRRYNAYMHNAVSANLAREVCLYHWMAELLKTSNPHFNQDLLIHKVSRLLGLPRPTLSFNKESS